ncbi:mannosyltransferase family protein [Streptomyces asiaticus]
MSADTAASTRAPEPPRQPPERRRVLGRVGASLGRAWLALAVYATVRAAGIVCVALGARQAGKHPRTQLGHYWDSLWYVSIAQHGYGTSHPSAAHPGLSFSDLAFFPLYPALIRAVTAIVPIGAVTAGLLIAWVAAGLAAWGIHAVGERLYGRRVALTLVALWGLLPHAVVESMGYTESLLTALAAWSLYALLTRRWLWAGALALCAGATRPNGLAVAAAVCVCAAAEIRRHRGRTSWLVWAGAALSPLGWLGYAAWVGVRRGTWHGYLDIQDDWGTYLDLGASGFRSARSLIMGSGHLSHYMALIVIGASLISLVGLALRPPPLPLAVYTLALVFIALASANYFASKPRFLLPAFPLLLPAALAMARARPRTAVLVGGVLAGLSCLYGTYLLTMATSPV